MTIPGAAAARRPSRDWRDLTLSEADRAMLTYVELLAVTPTKATPDRVAEARPDGELHRPRAPRNPWEYAGVPPGFGIMHSSRGFRSRMADVQSVPLGACCL
jgi:hypothetical protein